MLFRSCEIFLNIDYEIIVVNKSQTATEYLILLAVVIIIAVIVVSAMGGLLWYTQDSTITDIMHRKSHLS